MASNSQVLPPREASLFKKILKHFKEKQFKNGLKIANQILSNPKFSEHGETLSMKGLILNSMGKKQEALEYVKRGLKNDVKSHVCWHVFGLLHKADHKYEEAIKCYRNALRLKKDSVQILSDLCLVQIQTRDLEGYRDSRYQLFTLRPGERSTWIGCAMAYHLTGDHVTSVNILSEYQKTSTTSNNLRNRTGRRQINEIYEHSELLLYNVFILLECGRHDDALKILDQHENDIVDKVSYFEYKCQIYLALERFKDAQKVLNGQLISRNPENANYFDLMEKAMQVTTESQRLQLFEDLAQSYPRSLTIARIPLMFVSDLKIYRQKMDAYLKNGFRKGRPALFRDLKNLYSSELSSVLESFTYSKLDLSLSANVSRAEIQALIEKIRRVHIPPKIEVIESLLLNYMDNLKTTTTFDGDDQVEAITCLLWVYYFLAQHFDALKEFSLALYFANCAMAHTPTLIDIFVIKAKIFKHAGFPEKAAKYLDEAQSLDTSDRYLNSKCTKYLIRINKIKESEDMCVKFTREGVPAQENLNEMQCMWFQTEIANSYKRLGMWGEALKKCVEVDNHFAEINEDQLDFNSYCILKVTLRAYVQMIRLQDRIKSHHFFINASKTAIEVYLRLYDKPVGNQSENNDDANSHLSASELRKMRNKLRKAILKAEKENEKSGKKSNANNSNESKSESGEYIDPSKLEKTENPLEDVMRFLTPVKLFGRDLVEIHMLAFEVYFRKGKIFLQLQCLKRAFRICPVNSKFYPSLLRQTCQFLDTLYSRKEQFNEPLREVLNYELATLPGLKLSEGGDSKDIFNRLPNTSDFIEKYLPANSKSLSTRVEHIRAKHLLSQAAQQADSENNNNSSSASKVQPASECTLTCVAAIVKDVESLSDLTLEKCLQFYDHLKTDTFGKVPNELVEQLRQKFHQLYPYASHLMNEMELTELEAELADTDYFTADKDERCKDVEEN